MEFCYNMYGKQAEQPNSKIKLVIADDEENIRYLIRNMIPYDNLGMFVAGEASDGEEGLEICRRLNPDIVMVDIRMPLLNGLDMLKKIKQEFPDTVIIIISGYNDFEYAQKALEYEAFGYILKPIDEDELLRLLDKAKAKILQIRRMKNNSRNVKQELNKLQTLLIGGICPEIEDKPGGSIINRALMYIHNNYNNNMTLESVAEKIFVNATYLCELFRKETGKKFVDYITEIRIEKTKLLLRMPEFKIREIADMVGFNDVSYFIKTFKKYTGVTPNEYRNNEMGKSARSCRTG